MVTKEEMIITREEYKELHSLYAGELTKIIEETGNMIICCKIIRGKSAYYIKKGSAITADCEENEKSEWRYLSKKEKELIDKLRYRKGLEISLSILEENIHRLDYLLYGSKGKNECKYKSFNAFGVDELLPQRLKLDGWSFAAYCTKRGIYKNLMKAGEVQYDAATAEKWKNTCLYPEVKKEALEYHKENLTCDTGLGFFVRNKSEQLISVVIDASGLVYKYEEPIRLYLCNGNDMPDGFDTLNSSLSAKKILLGEDYKDDTANSENYKGRYKFYLPDFTILLPNSEIIVWEHIGRMDLEGYRESFYKKLEIYVRNGLYPGKNLFFTYEDKDHPLDIAQAKAMVTHLLSMK